MKIRIPVSKNGSWIHKIHTQGGFVGSNPSPDFSDSQSERFFWGGGGGGGWEGFEKSIFNKRFFKEKKRYPTDAVQLWLLTECWWRLINFMPLVTYHSILRETFVFQIDTDINFAYSFVAYVAFSSELSSLRGSVFFLPTRSTRTCRFMVNDPISDLLFFWQLRISITWDHKPVFGFSQNNAPQPWCRASFISSCWFCSTRLVKVGLWPWYTKMGITLYLYVD